MYEYIIPWCPGRAEEGIRFLGTGVLVTDRGEPPGKCWELDPGSATGTTAALPTLCLMCYRLKYVCVPLRTVKSLFSDEILITINVFSCENT